MPTSDMGPTGTTTANSSGTVTPGILPSALSGAIGRHMMPTAVHPVIATGSSRPSMASIIRGSHQVPPTGHVIHQSFSSHVPRAAISSISTAPTSAVSTPMLRTSHSSATIARGSSPMMALNTPVRTFTGPLNASTISVTHFQSCNVEECIARLTAFFRLPRTIKENALNMLNMLQTSSYNFKENGGEVIALSLVYLMLRNKETPISLRELSKRTGINQRDVFSLYPKLAKEMEEPLKPLNRSYLIKRLCGNLELPSTVKRDALMIAKKAQELSALASDSSSPTSLSAASVFMAVINSPETRSMDDVAKAGYISKKTIQSVFAKLNSCKQMLMQ